MMNHIIVVGSINMDWVVQAPRFPKPGETIHGLSWVTVPGGKGANQAVAAAKSGADVKMVGKVGNDQFGTSLCADLEQNGVDTTYVITDQNNCSGIAFITVTDTGANQIVVVPGANAKLSPNDLEQAKALFSSAKLLMLQMEVPWDTAALAIAWAHQSGIPVLLDPSPIPQPIPTPDWLCGIDILTPNQLETEALTGICVNTCETAQQAALILQQQGVLIPIIKLGAAGVVVLYENQFHHFPGHSVPVVDTTAAGDCFAGGLAARLAEGKSLLEAVTYANTAGALATTKLGAQSSIPSRSEVEQFLIGLASNR